MGIFIGQGALRVLYKEATAANLAGATSISTAYSIMRLRGEPRLCLFNNSTAADLSFAVVHPEADAGDPTQRLFLFEIPANTPLNFDTVNFTFEAGTSLFVWNSGGQTIVSPTKLRIFGWG